jgi:hypothetical protein
MAIQSTRPRLPGATDADLAGHEAIHVSSPWERAAERERAHRSLAALAALEPAESPALVLQAGGSSYPERGRHHRLICPAWRSRRPDRQRR